MRVLAGVTVAVLLLVGCGSDGDDDSESSAPETTTAADPPVSANVLFTGDSCDYEGPDEFPVGTEVWIAAVNTTTEPQVGFSLWKVPDGTTVEEIAEFGIFEVADEGETAQFIVRPPTSQDTDYRIRGLFDEPGAWMLDCFVLAETGDIGYPILLSATDD
ncbi:MAG: hypothetical protein ACR2OH_01240 [Microthrixaceae bacterium]